MMDTVLSLVDLANENDDLSFYNVVFSSSGNSGDSNNCGSGDSRGC